MTSCSWNSVQAKDCYASQAEAKVVAEQMAESATAAAIRDRDERRGYEAGKASWSAGYCRKKLTELEEQFTYYENKLKTVSVKRRTT